MDLKAYTKTLVTEDSNISNLVEEAIKQMQIEESKAEDEDIEEELTLEKIDEIQDEEFAELKEMVEDEQLEDVDYLENAAPKEKFEDEEEYDEEKEAEKIIVRKAKKLSKKAFGGAL